MMAKPDLLLIGPATQRMRDAMTAEFTIHELFEMDDQQGFLAEHGASIMAVATDGHYGVQPDVVAHLPNVKVISCYGVGYDNINAKGCAAKGIVVTHTPNVLNAEVANTAILLWLATSRRLVRDDRYIRDGRWAKEGATSLTRSVENRKVGILGLGRIGEEIARRLSIFSPEISYHSRNEKPGVAFKYYASLLDMARNIDTLICITPGGTATRHLVNRDVLEALGPESTLINVGRGTVVDEAEMVKALQDGRLGNAGLDVFEAEPHIPAELYGMDNVTLLPHVGSATVQTRQAMGDLVTDNFSRFLRDGTVISPVPECAHL